MKKVLVIGASGGIGNRVAEYLLERDYTVVGTYYQHPERVANLEAHPQFSSHYLDVTDTQKIQDLSSHHPEFYAIVNCSGIVRFEGESLESDLAIWKETLAVNLTGNYLVGKILGPSLVNQGRFIMISSTDANFGGAITASYAASKSGINSLTKSFSLLFQDKQIRVNSIAPGWVVTPMIEVNGDEFLEKVAAINPLKRNAKPEDVANVILFLLSAEAAYINGQVIALEGGYTNQDPTLLLEEEVQG